MLPRFDAKQALAAIGRTKTTALPGVPTMYQALLDHPDLARTDFSSLRVCISGGAPMPAELREKFVTATGASLVEGYGLTESSGVVATNPYEGPVRPGTIGQPLQRLEVAQDAGQLVAHPLDLVVGQPDARQPRDVPDLILAQLHRTPSPSGGSIAYGEASDER